ncbi:MAG: glycosyltransferase family 2 protein [Chloroflexota bacterium]
MDIVALIPAYQEATRVGPVIEGARAQLPVVVVDDGSTDDTAAVAEAAGATVLRQVPNQGKGAALRMGFRHALDAGCEAVVTLDADGQHDPTEIPAFLAAWAATRAPLIVGARTFGEMPLTRRIANELGTRTFSWAVGRHVADNQSGYRLIAAPLMRRLLDSRETGFEFEVEMITTAIRAGMAIEWVPIRTIYAGEGSHVRPVHHVRNFLRVSREARRTVRTPLPPLPPEPQAPQPASGRPQAPDDPEMIDR